MTSEAKQEVARLLLAGEKTSAIQYLSDTYTISVQDAKLLVETLEAEMSTGSIVSANPIIESSTAPPTPPPLRIPLVKPFLCMLTGTNRRIF